MAPVHPSIRKPVNPALGPLSRGLWLIDFRPFKKTMDTTERFLTSGIVSFVTGGVC